MVFVVIEGVDSAGKATQTKLLTDKLKAMGKVVETFSFPTKDHRSTTFIDKFQAGELGHPDWVDPYIASLYYSIDRFAHHATLTKKIQVYDVVIAEKYAISSFLKRWTQYLQEGNEDAMREFFSWLYDLEFQKAKLPYPDKIFFLSMSIKNIEANIRKDHEKRLLWIDQLDENHLLQQKYGQLIGKEFLPWYFENYEIINCEDDNGRLLTPQAIHQKILAKVLGEL